MKNELDLGTNLEQVRKWIIPTPAGQPIVIHAIQHIRRMHMDCRTWTLPQGDEKAVNLLLNVYHGYPTGYELPAHPVSEPDNGEPLSILVEAVERALDKLRG